MVHTVYQYWQHCCGTPCISLQTVLLVNKSTCYWILNYYFDKHCVDSPSNSSCVWSLRKRNGAERKYLHTDINKIKSWGKKIQLWTINILCMWQCLVLFLNLWETTKLPFLSNARTNFNFSSQYRRHTRHFSILLLKVHSSTVIPLKNKVKLHNIKTISSTPQKTLCLHYEGQMVNTIRGNIVVYPKNHMETHSFCSEKCTSFTNESQLWCAFKGENCSVPLRLTVFGVQKT